MKNMDEEMNREDEPQGLHPNMAPAEADPATAALTAETSEEEKEAGTPEEEQEDPYAGRALPGVTEQPQELPEEEPGEEEEEEEEPPAEADGQAPPLPPPADPLPRQGEMPRPAARRPSVPAPDAARERYWRSVLTGSAETVPDTVRQRAGQQDAGLSEEQSEYRLLSTINRSWAVDHLGVGKEQVRSGWARLREQLARRYDVADDERELFVALSVEAQDAPRREKVKARYEAQLQAALLGQEAPLAQEDEGIEEMAGMRELELEAWRRGDDLRRRYLSLARDVAEGLNVFAGMEENAFSAPRVLASLPGFGRAVESLAQMDEPTRRVVYTLAQAEYRDEHPQREESLWRTMRRATARGATSLGLGVGQALTHASVASLNAFGTMLGEETGESLRGSARALDQRSRIVEEIRHLLYDEVQPLEVGEEAGLASQLLVDAAGSTPTAIAACCGGAGFASLSLSGMGEAVAAARRRAPEGSQWLQYLAGVLGGGIQAAIYAGMSRVGGQMLSNAISSFARASGKGAGGYALASLSTLSAMGFEEAKLLFASKTADVVGLGTQELAARLEKTASNIDWKEYGDNAQDLEMNLREAAMTLPFILISSGRVALRHFRSRRAVLGEGYALQQWGIDEATREAVMKESDINRQGELLREALRSSRRWSAPGFIAEAMRALRLLNTDYFQAFKDQQAVVDFLKLPSRGGQVPRPPLVPYSADNPEHTRLLRERHGGGEKVNARRLPMALQLYDEWVQKAHIVPDPAAGAEASSGEMLPTSARRHHYGLELLELGRLVPPRMQPGGFYAPHAASERMAMLRDRVAEIHDLSYQVLLASFPLDVLSHSTRSIDHLRADGEKARASLLEAVGRSVIRRATGVPEEEALDELGKSVTNYFGRRRYTYFPPGWMSKVPFNYTYKLDEQARATFHKKLAKFPAELRDAYRVALGFRACSSALYELLPTVPDFQTSLARGLSPAESYVHLLSRELGVDMAKARGVEEMLAPYGPSATDMRAYRRKNEAAYDTYRLLTGCELESAKGEETGAAHWRVRRPDGSYTNWHRRRSDAINDLVANTSFTFMPFSYDRTASLRTLDPGSKYDLNAEGKAGPWHFTGYDHLCRIALRDTARSWVESAPYAQPGFEMSNLRRYLYLGGQHPQNGVLMREGGTDAPGTMQVDTYTLSSPLRLAQARFRTFWWRELQSGLISAEEAGNELVKLRVITPEELARVQDIAKPLLMPRGRNVPLKDTPPPDIAGMKWALAEHLSDFSLRYFLAHLDDMPLPPSAREWFRLAPLCPLEEMPLPGRAVRLSVKEDDELFTCQQNRVAVRELREAAPGVADLRQVEREGLLAGSRLLAGVRNAVGLNQAQNLEQGWCSELSACEAMMGMPQTFWRLLERPADQWADLGESDRDLLRNHAEAICRSEPSPEAMEAEARGEQPDYFKLGLLNLQEVLQDYPALHQYGLARLGAPGSVCRLVPEEPGQGGDPFAEPEYERAPLYTGGKLQKRYSVEESGPLPDWLQDDSRVMPALHLLGQLRTYPANRPYVSSSGIHWQGQLYGGDKGLAPGMLAEGWTAEAPLVNLIDLLGYVDWLKHSEGKIMLFGMEVPGLGKEKLDLRPLSNVTLYRSNEAPANLCRLMPGEPEAANVSAQLPYLVHSLGGSYLSGNKLLFAPEDMHHSYIPLEKFQRAFLPRISLENRYAESREASLRYTLSGMLSGSVRMDSQSDPQGGLAGMRELLMRMVEDTGFSLSLKGADPRQLSQGQLLALRLSRELLFCVCGDHPVAAFRRLERLSDRILRKNSEREAVYRALYSSADSLYQRGQGFFRPARPKRHYKPKRKSNYMLPNAKPGENAALDDWVKQFGSRSDFRDFGENEESENTFNDSVRPDGYSKGFFDD